MPQPKSKRPRPRAQTTRTAARPKRRPPAVARVSVSLEKELIAHAWRYAREHRTTIAALLAEGLRKVSGFAKAPVLPPGDLATQPAEAATPGWDQMLAWMEDQQATLTQIRDAIGEVAASLPADPGTAERPPAGKRIPPV